MNLKFGQLSSRISGKEDGYPVIRLSGEFTIRCNPKNGRVKNQGIRKNHDLN